ncbi:MAG: hypothetical protein KC731_42010 [Myxococcales bacterium]|nr:hypothetical protein [Myxococcales bacterium]
MTKRREQASYEVWRWNKPPCLEARFRTLDDAREFIADHPTQSLGIRRPDGSWEGGYLGRPSNGSYVGDDAAVLAPTVRPPAKGSGHEVP